MRDNSLCLVLQKLLSLAKHNYGTNKVSCSKYLANFDIETPVAFGDKSIFSNIIKYLFRYTTIHQEVTKQ